MKDFKVHAILCLSNHGGIGLMIDESGEAVRWQWYDDKPTKRWQAIKYTRSGDPYVTIKGRRFKLDEFMRVLN